MENDRFDNLTRLFATSRRQLLKGLAGSLLGGAAILGSDRAGAAVICRAGGVRCSEDAQCCSGVCDPTTHQCACAGGQLLCRDRCIPACTALDACHVAGSCDPSSGQCTNPPAQAGIACGAAPACANGVATGQATCDGAGHCAPGAATKCSPYVCGVTACLTSCTSNADCASNHFCTGGVCTSVAPNGRSCTSAGQCQSGFCVDGVCCDTACTDQCAACNVSGNLGTCIAVTGAPHGNRAACASDGSNCAGSCNGSTTQGCSYAGSSTSCRQASCANGSEILAASCNGQGACSAVQTKSCAPYVCGTTSCLTSCTSAADCASGNYCSGGSCVTQQANGTTCTSGGQCTSGHCVDGYCCDTACTDQCAACNVAGNLGTCTAVTGAPVGGRAACTGAGTTCGGSCDGMHTQSCSYPGSITSCRAASCANGIETFAAACNGVGYCPAAVGQSCGAYLCGPDACLTSCTADSQCVSTGYCDTSTTPGTCKQDLANGQACSRDHQCTSGNCVDGYCCNAACAGQCEACDVAGSVGTCTAVSGAPHSSRIACTSDGTVCGGTCNGTATQSCTYPANTTTCGTGPTCTNDTAKAQDMCNGAGACSAGASTSCAPYACGATSCLTSCTTATDCASGNSCSGGKCVAQLSNGTACTAADQCASGFCVDGYCCNNACTGQCEACDVTGHLGGCTAVTGMPHGSRTACTTDGSVCGGICEGTNPQSCSYPGAGTVCQAGTCANGEATGQSTCDGAGNCTPGSTVVCAPYKCNSAGTACTASCTSTTDCASGAVCCGGTCFTGTCCADTDCTDANPCTTDACDLTTHTCTHTAVTPGTSCGKYGQTCCGSVCLGSPCDATQCQSCDAASGSCVACAGQTGQITCIPGTDGAAGVCCQVGEVCIFNGGETCCTGTLACTVDGCCPPGRVCSPGTSTVCCDADKTCCGHTTCADLQTDLNNCGTCGNACAAGDACIGGTCVRCDTICHGGNDCNANTCTAGQCGTTPVTDGTPCHAGQGICQSGTCVTSSSSAYSCTPGQAVCNFRLDTNNYHCYCSTDVDGSVACVAIGGSCTSCVSDDDCAALGYSGYACTQASNCSSGTSCVPYCPPGA